MNLVIGVLFGSICGQLCPSSPYIEVLPTRTYPGELDATVLLFEPGLFDAVGSDLIEQWMDDMAAEGHRPVALEATFPDAQSLRSWLIEWMSWELDVRSIILIGNHPYAMCRAEIYDPDRSLDSLGRAEESFPSDLYFCDLTGSWVDSDEDGEFDVWTGSCRDYEAEISCGRIAPLDVSAEPYYFDPISLLRAYIQRNHIWRRTNGWDQSRLIVYCDDSWIYGTPDNVGNAHYVGMHDWCPATDYYMDRYLTRDSDYRPNRLSDPDYLWATVLAHSNHTSHSWYDPDHPYPDGPPVDHTTVAEILSADCRIPFFNLFACSACNFALTSPPIGAAYLLGTDYGLAVIGTTKTGGMFETEGFYEELADGASLGWAMRQWWNFLLERHGGWLSHPDVSVISRYFGMVIIGDPTLVPNMHWGSSAEWALQAAAEQRGQEQ